MRGKCSTREHLISWHSFARTAWAEEILEIGRHVVTRITFVDISIFLLISWPIPSDTPFNSTNRFCGHGSTILADLVVCADQITVLLLYALAFVVY